LIISVLPIIISSFYSHPIADDFGFSEKVYHVVKSGGGLFDVLSVSFQQVKDTYLGWQGTYAAIFIFGLQPAAFSENLYFLTAIVMLISLIASTMFFIDTIFSVMGFNKTYGFIISSIILLLSIHFVVNKNEAFFWWNGSSYYTLFYAFSLLLFTFLIRLYYTDKKTKRIIFIIISSVLSLFIGGGNYSTALLTTVIMVIVLIVIWKSNKKLLPFYLIVFAILLAGFIISMIAPGNSVRAAAVNGESPIKAVVHSVLYTVTYIAKWTGLAQIAGFIIIGTIAFFITKKSKYQYKYPLLVFIASVLIFATQLTPPLYAMSSVGAGRQVNIYYYSYYLLISFNIFYLCGWINRKKILMINSENFRKSYALCGTLIIFCVFLGGCLNYGFHNITFVDTLLALKNGTPQVYDIEYMDRIADIKSGNTNIKDIESVPDFFAPLNIQEDSNSWINKQIARYYDVDKITLKTE
jgi:hypothetical protein